MSFNIMDAVKAHLTPDLISKASSFLGENNTAVGKAISGILPTVIGGLISKTTSTSNGANEVFNMAKEANSTGFLSNIGNFFGDGGGLLSMGSGLLKSIFGSKTESIIESIAGFAGINKSSAHSLLSFAAPVALSTLGKHASENNLNPVSLTSLVNGQKNNITNMLPDGLSGLAGILGFGKVSTNSVNITDRTRRSLSATTEYADETTRNAGGGLKRLLPLLLLAAALLAAWLLWKGCNKKATTNGTVSDSTTVLNPVNTDTINISTSTTLPSLTVDSLSGLINYDLGKDIEFTLPNGGKFMAAERGFESQLLGFIKDGTIDTVNKSANWFNMFDVQFKTGGNVYAGKAEAQLKNCAAILKDYPFVKIKLGGYTDNTGSASANTKISQQRADKVKADLIKMGANADQIAEAVGYGPLFPVCEANDTKECQARNRRVACKVAVK